MDIFSISDMQKDVLVLFINYCKICTKNGHYFENSGHFESENIINKLVFPDKPIFIVTV